MFAIDCNIFYGIAILAVFSFILYGNDLVFLWQDPTRKLREHDQIHAVFFALRYREAVDVNIVVRPLASKRTQWQKAFGMCGWGDWGSWRPPDNQNRGKSCAMMCLK